MRLVARSIVIILISAILVFSQTGVVLADPAVTPPRVPTPPPVPVLTDTPPPAPTLPPAPTFHPTIQSPTPTPSSRPAAIDTPSPTPIPSSSPAIKTGNSTVVGSATQSLDNNLTSSPVNQGGHNSSLGNDPIISGNGDSSTNQISSNQSKHSTVSQSNSASGSSQLNLSTDTGGNSASNNVGSASIKTGDANTSGVAVAAVNTNLTGVGVSEFNVADDHIGDIVLNFANNCVALCQEASSSAGIIGNGQNSQNAQDITSTSSSSAFQHNDASVENSLVLNASSGKNNANDNTGGSSSISTGNANVSGSLLTLANNNIAGKVLYGVVDIFGKLVGDIILPSSQYGGTTCGSCSNPQLLATINNNGDGSGNNLSVNTLNNGTLSQGNETNIENNVNVSSNTGGNKSNDNTGGTSSIQTGSASASINVINIANNNLNAGDYLLLIINKAGQMIGELFGPSNTNQGTNTASISENGDNSNNKISSNTQQTISTSQQNTAVIKNQLGLTANTGDNSTSFNTGGDSSITTGNSNVIATLVNFVNNNISSSSKLIVSVVNVFGSWIGSFIGPNGQKIITFSSPAPVPNQAVSLSSQPESVDNGSHPGSTVNSPTENATPLGLPASVKSASPNFFTPQPTTSLNAASLSHPSVPPQGLGSSTTLVAGFKESVHSLRSQMASVITRPKIDINLAYIVLLLPILLAFLGIRLLSRKVGKSHGIS